MFGNCPWNLNSSILVNSAAERQAQKRKIRNGQLPMPKLIKTSASNDVVCLPKSINLGCQSISDSLLPDTVVISEDIESENTKGSSKECCDISCTVPKHSALSVENEICSTALANTPKRFSYEVSGRLENPLNIVRSTVNIDDHGFRQVSGEILELSNVVCQRGFIDLNNSSLLRMACLEKGDGLVLKLGISKDSPRILTVVQENRITFWESPSLQQLSWSKRASIPISINFICGQEPFNDTYTNNFLLELGLRPGRWTSVVLLVNPNPSKCSLYGYSDLGATKIIDNLTKSPLANKNQKKLYSCLLDSSTTVIWHYNEGKGTTLKKYLLNDDLDDLLEENELIGTESNIQSLHLVDATKPIVVGVSKELKVILWNHITGNVIKYLDLFSSEIHSCLGIIEDKGFLFIIANGKPGSVHLLTVNLNTKGWIVLKTYTSNLKECISGFTIDNGLLMAAYQDGIVVWDMKAAVELSCFLPQRKCVPYLFSRDTVFVSDDYVLYIIDNSLIFQMQRRNQLSEKLEKKNE